MSASDFHPPWSDEAEPSPTEAEPKKRRKRGASPTARTLAYLRKLGVEAGVVERRNPRAFITHDLFGFIDVVAIPCRTTDTSRIVGIQATSGSNAAARVTKIRDEPRHHAWLAAGGTIEVWAWRKVKKATKAGTKVERWEVRVTRVESEREVVVEDVAAEYGVL